MKAFGVQKLPELLVLKGGDEIERYEGMSIRLDKLDHRGN